MSKQPSKYQTKKGKVGSASFNVTLDEKQKRIVGNYLDNQINITTGDPGTGKTFMAMYYAIKALNEGNIGEIIISKSPIETGKGIGFLPGAEDDKLAPYKESFIDIIKKISPENAGYWLDQKKIRFEAMSFVRGKTFENAIIILDEIQNCTLKELMSFVTRISNTSQMILMGDFYQTDIKDSGLKDFINITKGVDSIYQIELDDTYQKRARIITEIFNNYKKFVDKNR